MVSLVQLVDHRLLVPALRHGIHEAPSGDVTSQAAQVVQMGVQQPSQGDAFAVGT